MSEFKFPPLKISWPTNDVSLSGATTSQGGAPRIHVDPGVLGSYKTASVSYDFLSKIFPGTKFFGQLYWPLAAVGEKFPLVVIVHARRAAPNPHLMYSVLAKHLASHGFVVISISRGSPHKDGYLFDEVFDILLQETISWLYGTTLKNMTTDDVAIIAHSSGGGLTIENFHRIRFPNKPFLAKNLVSLVLFAPIIPPNFTELSKNFDLATDSFLGIHTVDDDDKTAFGLKDPFQIMRSTFRMYDTMGKSTNSSQFSLIEKDMIFANLKVASPGVIALGHFFQDHLFARVYVTSFLLKQMKQQSEYEKYLKLQMRPTSLASQTALTIWHQHEGRGKFSISDFDHSDGMLSEIKTSASGIKVGLVLPWLLDSRSPHATKCLRILWDRTKAAPFTENSFTLNFKSPLDVTGYGFLSFRMCQASPGINQTLQLRIIMGTAAATVSPP